MLTDSRQAGALSTEVQELADRFARYLWAWTDETSLGEPDFDNILNATELADFLAAHVCHRGVGREFQKAR